MSYSIHHICFKLYYIMKSNFKYNNSYLKLCYNTIVSICLYLGKVDIQGLGLPSYPIKRGFFPDYSH
uniref:Uncharacterized protein n=1 Tax=viral metagenome TaxID=1070528 RepID=A0A6C0EKF4_9ZZZZ